MSERRIAREVLKQNLSGIFVFIPNETQSEQKTTECIFVIIRVHCLARYTLDFSCHIAQLAHKLRVGCYGIRLDGKGKPRKADGVLGNVQWQVLCKE